MKELFSNTIQLLKGTLNAKVYAFCFLLIAAACYYNYYTDIKLWPTKGNFLDSVGFLSALFLFFFITGFLITSVFFKIRVSLSNKYIPVLLIAPLLFALKVCLPFDELLLNTASPAYQLAFVKAASWFGAFAFTVSMLLLLHFYFERKWNLYFTAKTKSWLPYIFLVIGMIPLIMFAAAQPDFQRMYPRARDLQQLGTSASTIHYLLFEFSYALDFITIELFFRGFLIATISRVLGIHCIIPVALFYFSIHLGKPMLEAISSFFGGLLLGAVSYHTKSIWGGWLVHVGIALIMELMGFLFNTA